MNANQKQISGTHYKLNSIQPWDYVAANNLGYFEGSAIKYITRWRSKGGVADLQKAIHFLEKLIELQVPVERESPKSNSVSPFPGIKASSESSYPMGRSNYADSLTHPSGYTNNSDMGWVELTEALRQWHGKE